MDIHPWTKYEIARMRDEERLLQARQAALVREARAARRGDFQPAESTKTGSLLERLRRRTVVAERASAESGA